MKVSFGIGFGAGPTMLQGQDASTFVLPDHVVQGGQNPRRWVGLGGGDFDRQRRELRLLGEEIMPRFAV